MKKFFAILCAGLLLTGCGSGSKEKTTKTCTLEGNGAKVEMIMNAEGDTVTGAEMTMAVPYSALGLTKEDTAGVTDEQVQTVVDQLLTQYKLNDVEGVTSKGSFDDNGLKIVLTIEISSLEQILGATSLSDMVKEAESQGYTCK